jgi:hypothetical protein
VDAQSIATYSCPSFKSVPVKVVARRQPDSSLYF